MAMHHIVCIHGIGQHGKEWVTEENDLNESFETLLKKLWNTYGATQKRGDFDACVKLHSVCYDDEIEKIFTDWSDYAEKLKEGLKFSAPLSDEVAWFTDAIDTATQAKNDEAFGYTHLLDLLLFAGSPTVQGNLVAHVGKQIMAIIDGRAPGDRVSLIGHSMGAAMAHKTIQALYGQRGPDGKSLLQGKFKFESVTMVGNTSYALSRDRARFYEDTVVRPSLDPTQGCCYKWINVNHRWDPVGQFRRFQGADNPVWLDQAVNAMGWHQNLTPTLLSSKSIHAINHYFRDPALHLPFLELTFDLGIDKKEKLDAVTAFAGGSLQGQFKALASHLEKNDVRNNEKFSEFILALRDFREALMHF